MRWGQLLANMANDRWADNIVKEAVTTPFWFSSYSMDTLCNVD